MRNDTPSQVILKFTHIDHASKMTTAMEIFRDIAGMGGDVELLIKSNNREVYSCGVVGHDVRIEKIQHFTLEGVLSKEVVKESDKA